MRTTTLQILSDGRLKSGYLGPPSTGEDNAMEVATRVVSILRTWGEVWGDPIRPATEEAGADIIAPGPSGELRLQITRVPRIQAFWRTISEEGHVSTTAAPEEFARQLLDAIRYKRDRYAPSVLACTMLVLDGSQQVAFDTPPVLNAFTRHHLQEAQASGFADIFLLGGFRFVNLLRPQATS